MVKQTMTLEDILGYYYYKYWIQKELRNIGESISETKDELIDRFLHSKETMATSVSEVARNLIASLRKTDLIASRKLCIYKGYLFWNISLISSLHL